MAVHSEPRGEAGVPPRAPAAPPSRDRRGGGPMAESLPLGRIAGVPVGLNWSMLFIFLLVAWSLADQLFPQAAPEMAAGAYWGAALLATVLFYASLLVHEVGHAVVARRRGVEVEGITLWLFGGVARLRGEASSAEAELRIAVVGPLISLGCAVFFALMALGLAVLQQPALVVAVPAWLSLINLMLAVFNVLPAFPLDGGRVLRALLWRHRHNRISATRTAASVGSGFAYLLMVGGLVEFFTTDSVGGLWFIFLGWFLLSAARAEAGQSLLRDVLRDMRVADVMSADPVAVPDWIVLQEFVDAYAMRHRFTTFPVRDFDGRIDGLVGLSQVKAVPPEQHRSVRVRDIAWPLQEVPVARREEPLVDLLERMSMYQATRALVLEDGHVVGIVSPVDVSRALQLASLRESGGPEPR